MITILFPAQNFRLKKENNKEFIFDEVRKQWIKLTPEEWVRQNFIQYLIQTKKYPASLMAIEKEIHIGELKRRCDIVVYSNNLPWMIIECKEMNVALNDKVIEQVFNYNRHLQVPYLIITNGKETFGLDTKNKTQLKDLPTY
ncbi:MAG: type I restriction enzyme HsdR N-terminal domain-containing protein [Bacteroidetes bacterium]|nr:type I restriction enzyme HsdR N-terminal domain-containing protein [Bacteroidota bacterium]MBS1649504.1 type I restriction enzyme HsdR N-terminal domain-containing protein [Bacteroidota bacterium]